MIRGKIVLLHKPRKSNMKKSLLFLLALFISFAVLANDDDSLAKVEAYHKLIDSVNNSMKYSTGNIKLPGGTIELKVPEGFKFLDAAQSRKVLEDLWGNPPDTKILGMIFPEKYGPLTEHNYAFVVTYEAVGYVKDDDADKIDYDDLLKEMREGEAKDNAERQKNGYPSIHMLGWASKPYYDKENKILHWAKNLKFGDAESSTLNYDVRILGRKGILSLNAVATMEELDEVKRDIPKVIHIATFTEGNTYKDFNPDVDEVAAWTIGGLVAGKVLAKVGVLAFFGKFIKFIVIGVAGLGAWIWKLFRRRKEEKEGTVEYEETPAVAEVQEATETPAAPEAPTAPQAENENK